MTGVIINNNEYQVSTGSTKIEYNSMGGESVGYSMYGSIIPSLCTFTINATPSDATVTINGESKTSITAPEGTVINWSVSKSGYGTQNGTYTLVDNHIETVTLAVEWVDLSFYSFGNMGTFSSQGSNVIESRWRNMLKGYMYTSGSYDLTKAGCVKDGYQKVWFTYSKPIYIEYLKISGCEGLSQYASVSDEMGYQINDGYWHYTSLYNYIWGATNKRSQYKPNSFVIQNVEVSKLGLYIRCGSSMTWTLMYVQAGDTPILKQRA